MSNSGNKSLITNESCLNAIAKGDRKVSDIIYLMENGTEEDVKWELAMRGARITIDIVLWRERFPAIRPNIVPPQKVESLREKRSKFWQ